GSGAAERVEGLGRENGRVGGGEERATATGSPRGQSSPELEHPGPEGDGVGRERIGWGRLARHSRVGQGPRAPRDLVPRLLYLDRQAHLRMDPAEGRKRAGRGKTNANGLVRLLRP